MRRRDGPQRGLDGGDRRAVLGHVVEGLGVAQHGLRAEDAVGRGLGVAPRAKELCVLELPQVIEGGPGLELTDARLDARADLLERRRREELVPDLDVRVDGQHLHAVRPEEAGQHRDREVGRRGIAGRRVDEGDLHRPME